MTLDHLREIALIQISQAQRTNAMTFTRKLPKGHKRIVVLAGQTFRGVLHFEETAYDVSPSLADLAIEQGIARLHEDQH